MSMKRTVRSLGDRLGGEPYERALAQGAREKRDRVVFYWNRGLGDIALGLVPMFARAKARIALRPIRDPMSRASGNLACPSLRNYLRLTRTSSRK